MVQGWIIELRVWLGSGGTVGGIQSCEIKLHVVGVKGGG